MNKRLPPFGKRFRPVPSTGVRVAIGSAAWDFAESHHAPVMVLPVADDPSRYRWPSDGKPALVFEWGEFNDELLDAVAYVLLEAGAASVVAIREALLNDHDCRVFYDKEVIRVAA